MVKQKSQVERVVTFGEIMLRLTPPLYHRIEQTNEFHVNYGGGEANVAVALENLGLDVTFVTKLPNNQLGDGAIKYLRSQGVNCDYIVKNGDNIGIYFLENGFGGRPSRVLYNRKHSAFTEISPDELDFDAIFNDIKWFHVSGVTLALSESVRETTLQALKKAKEYGVTVSFDFNYRSKLWTIEEAREAIKKIIPYVDVCFASLYDLTTILEFKTDSKDRASIMQEFAKAYDIDYIFGTDREVITATENILSAYVYMPEQSLLTKEYKVNIFDRVGGGDAFASGVIYGLLKDYQNYEFAVEFGLACSVLKHTIFGDSSILKVNEIINYMKTSGREVIDR
jgi:2-dehydro-3-deoxygluconokinase